MPNAVAILLSVRTESYFGFACVFPHSILASFASVSINATLRTRASVRACVQVCVCVCVRPLLSARSFACQLARKCNDVYWRRC